ncbi:hypothetical protein L596_014179 [Steinernema carpocapsae]|uniref:Uncharacterized protein n=1 Tax=Steinernema carpocapsae TaxID=34508 RepID=A0A4U5NBP8_STECR|nr:hypothetical protein L596_014179 [Steinernema carpocapsae]
MFMGNPDFPSACFGLEVVARLLMRIALDTRKEVEHFIRFYCVECVGQLILKLKTSEENGNDGQFSELWRDMLKMVLDIYTENESSTLRAKACRVVSSLVEVEPAVMKILEIEYVVKNGLVDFNSAVRKLLWILSENFWL